MSQTKTDKEDRVVVAVERPFRQRIVELDAARGFAVIMMILHHFIFDLRYVFDLPVFAFQDSEWFICALRAPFLALFLMVSGISSNFSRSNLRRGIRLLFFALSLTVITLLMHNFMTPIYFNILHVLALSIIIYALTERVSDPKRRSACLIMSALLAFLIGTVFLQLSATVPSWLLPLNPCAVAEVEMSDYLSFFPWSGFFFLGAVLGSLLYPKPLTLFPNLPRTLALLLKPFSFVGRYAIYFYIFHQPFILACLYGLRILGLL
ncbi:MAG: DUF1624 domain-containing protein [Clostridiaceae bacterium]|nr:DUF1624 domain-containing protein [Clostridiaceae bacterium]